MKKFVIAERRRTQEERSAATRRLVLDAALDCLVTLGYAATTTTEVALRAGVSRGAQLHHFPTRSELLSAAVQHLFARLREDYERKFPRAAPRTERVGAAIDLLWRTFQDDRLSAVLDLYVAARTDPALCAELGPVTERHHALVVELARTLIPESAARNGRFESVLDLVLETLQGLAVHRMVRPDDRSIERTLGEVKAFAIGALAG